MIEKALLEDLENKAITPDDLAEDVKENLTLLPTILEGITWKNANVKFGCAKILRTVSQERPEELYSKMDFFIDLMDSTNNIIKWNVIDIVSNLTKVDKDDKFDKIFNEYYALLSNKSMVTAAHIIDNSGNIALAKPHLTKRITHELLNIEKLSRNQECMNILQGKVILAFDKYYDQIENKDAVISFAKRQLNNSRPATKKKAEKFLKKVNG